MMLFIIKCFFCCNFKINLHENVNFQQLFVVVKTTESEEWTSLFITVNIGSAYRLSTT